MADSTGGPLPYVEVTDPQYAVTAADTFVLEEYGSGLQLLRGPCPRCGATVDIPVVGDVVRSQLRTTSTDPATASPSGDSSVEPVICTCRDPHEGRPEGRVGCGAYWNFIL